MQRWFDLNSDIEERFLRCAPDTPENGAEEEIGPRRFIRHRSGQAE